MALHFEKFEPRINLSALTLVESSLFESSDFAWRPSFASLIDVDGDVDLDVMFIVSGTRGKGLYLMENVEGAGEFAGSKSAATLEGVDSVFALGWGDFDMDGDEDLLINAGNGNYLLSNDGDGQFEEPMLIAPAKDIARFVSDGVDIDRDGDLDAIVSTRGGAEWLRNLGDGEFELLPVSQGADGEGIQAVVNGLSDLDGDGDLDGYGQTIDAHGDRATLFLNNAGVFAPVVLDLDFFDVVVAFDIDGDGDSDLLASTGEQFAWMTNNGAGEFTDRGLTTIQDTAFRTPRFVVGDIDGDSVADLVSFEYVCGLCPVAPIELHLNRGQGEFLSTILIDSLPGPMPIGHGDVDIGDVNGDGVLDILTHQTAGFITALASISLFKNRLVGDSNDDGIFDSSDLVRVFQNGEFEDEIDNNSTFDEGDWNQDGDFNSSDFVFAFQQGHYVFSAATLATEIAAVVDGRFAHDDDSRGKSRAFIS